MERKSLRSNFQNLKLMNRSPFFSIIIPTYNRGYIIRQPIDSIISQTFTDWELIIVDDGSTDHTRDVVESYKDERIKYVWQQNQERSAARNHGISLAKGEWICFQDSDDEYLPDHLRVLYVGIIQFPEYKVFRTGMLIYENGKLLKIPKFDVQNEYELYPFDAFTTFAFEQEVFCQVRFKKELVNSQDLHLLLRVNAIYELKIIKKHTNIYHYNSENGAGLGKNYQKIHNSKILCFNDLLSLNLHIKESYLKRKLCLSNILILIGHIKYNQSKIFKALFDNIMYILKYPKEYMKLIIRIIYVKFCESFLNKSFQYRF